MNTDGEEAVLGQAEVGMMGEITLPPGVQDRLSLLHGMSLEFVLDENGRIVVRVDPTEYDLDIHSPVEIQNALLHSESIRQE